MTKQKFTQPNPGGANPHDYFGRKMIGDPLIAGDILRFYANPVVAKHVDLDHLQPEPTQFFGPAHPIAGSKEVILDVPYISRFRDEVGNAEVLIVNELKSAPSLYVLLQLAVQAILALYKRWTDAGRPASNRNFKVPVPIMVLVYCGPDDLPDDLSFQDIFDDIPEELRPLVLQYRLVVVNLRRFGYDNLPGKPDTQAVVEAMKRGTDGTLGDHLEGVIDRMASLPIDDRIMDIIGNITWLGGRVADVPPERIVQVITNVIKGKEGVEMAETIQRGIFQQGVAEGEARGEARGKLNKGREVLLKILRARFKRVPRDVENTIRKMTDPIALDSWAVHAATCESMNEFAEAIR